MTKFFSKKYEKLVPYTPGEQPQNRKYIKLNTNESPYPPSPIATKLAREAAANIQLYSDPEMKQLREVAAEKFGISVDEIMFNNGSDETLNFAFMAYCDSEHPAAFPNISYGFYPVFAELNNIPYEEIPLDENYRIRVEDYIGINKTIFIANPNAPTGIALTRGEIERILESNPENVVVIDEAYVDFGGESCVSLINKYKNLLVVQTCSKSRSLAGGRLGYAIACKEIIADLNTIRYSTNPYNVNSMTIAAGIGAFPDETYFRACCGKIIASREKAVERLKALDFEILPSCSNFIFAKNKRIGGLELYTKLKEMGILVRHFEKPRLKDYNRITIGTDEQMEALAQAVEKLLEETK